MVEKAVHYCLINLYYNDIIFLSFHIRYIVFELVSNTVGDYCFWKHPLWSYLFLFPTYPYQTPRYVKLLMGGRGAGSLSLNFIIITNSYIGPDLLAPAPQPEFCSSNQECTITEFTPGKACLQSNS